MFSGAMSGNTLTPVVADRETSSVIPDEVESMSYIYLFGHVYIVNITEMN